MEGKTLFQNYLIIVFSTSSIQIKNLDQNKEYTIINNVYTGRRSRSVCVKDAVAATSYTE